MMFPFGEYLPDLPDIGNPGNNKALNVVPRTKRSYGPWKMPEQVSTNTMDARPQGAVTAVDYSGTTYNFTGDATKLYRYTGSTFTDVSKVGGYTSFSGYTDKITRAWRFAQYGNLLVATNFADDPQVWALGTDSAFSDLASSAPKARYAAVVGEHLVLANTSDAFDGHIGLRLWVGPIGQPTFDDWGNTNLQSTFFTLGTGSEITGIVGGEYGIVFGRTAVYRMTYSGPPTIFRLDEIRENHGCIAPGSLVQSENNVFYLSQDGFHRMVNGQSAPIGEGKIDNTFFADLDLGNLDRMCSTIDPSRKLYLVSYPSQSAARTSADGSPNKVLAYNYDLNEWSEIEQEADIIQSLRGAALTLEDVGAIYPILEDVPGAYENPAFVGGGGVLSGLMADGSLSQFTGPNKGFVLDSTEQMLQDGQKSVLRKIRPVTDCDCPEVAIGTRNNQSQDPTFTASVAPNAQTYQCSFRAKARYHRARMTAPDGWTGTEITGFDGIRFNAVGGR